MLFTVEKVKKDVAVVDFSSMYPSLIKDGGISPECIDFIDALSSIDPPFDSIRIICSYKHSTHPNCVDVGMVGLGINGIQDGEAVGVALIGEYFDTVTNAMCGMKETISRSVEHFVCQIK